MAQTHAGSGIEPPAGSGDVVVRRRGDSAMLPGGFDRAGVAPLGDAFSGDAFGDGFDSMLPGPPGPAAPGATVNGPVLDAVVDAVVERIEQRVIDELERRGGRHPWGVF
jgi:hypothetical protein